MASSGSALGATPRGCSGPRSGRRVARARARLVRWVVAPPARGERVDGGGRGDDVALGGRRDRLARLPPRAAAARRPWSVDASGGVVFTAGEIAAATGGEVTRAAAPGSVSTDTRSLLPGQWFLALVGDAHDGNAFARDALAAGCAGMISSRPPPAGWPAGYVRVGDTLDALQALASDVRGRFDGPVVGITGSVGKTTTRALVAAALEASPGFARVHATSGNMNNHVGVPLTLLRMPPDTDACVLEMGMSGPGEIATLARVARPTVRVVLNVRPAHLEGAGGDLGDVARAKSEMFADAREGDACVVNADDAYVRAMRIPPGCRVASFGEDERAALEDERADVRVLFSADAETPSTFALTATKRSSSGGGVGAGVVGRRRRASVVVSGPLRVALTEPGAHLAPCAAAAAAAALSLGADLGPALADAMRSYAAPAGRMRPVPAAPERYPRVTCIDDAYNANPASVANALATLRAERDAGRRTAAMLGDMLELGAASREYHREVVRACLDHGFDVVGFAGEAFKAAVEDVRAEREDAARVFVADDADALWRAAGAEATKVDARGRAVVLVKGSRSTRMDRVVRRLTAEAEEGEGGGAGERRRGGGAGEG